LLWRYQWQKEGRGGVKGGPKTLWRQGYFRDINSTVLLTYLQPNNSQEIGCNPSSFHENLLTLILVTMILLVPCHDNLLLRVRLYHQSCHGKLLLDLALISKPQREREREREREKERLSWCIVDTQKISKNVPTDFFRFYHILKPQQQSAKFWLSDCVCVCVCVCVFCQKACFLHIYSTTSSSNSSRDCSSLSSSPLLYFP
jgi:hypothetical protein